MADKAAAKAAARAKFEGVFDTIADELLAYLKGEGMPADAVEWYKKVSRFGTMKRQGGSSPIRRSDRRRRSVFSPPREEITACAGHLLTAQNLYHNVPGGKLNRGLSVVDTLEILKGSPLTDDEYFQAALLGWCIELVSDKAGVCVMCRLSGSALSSTDSTVKLTFPAPGLLPCI